ncbi:hypothetical protein NDU88_009414 [Pleurodeles waltl]|uniref:Uncharacterized protein n=1 Tax=Pleurodeles waltl TaxID=8319 RepID=A0AAV7QXA0_PLEWA|nr:hypothetical protein NDU88_009414 [Pleurodeles waltl]
MSSQPSNGHLSQGSLVTDNGFPAMVLAGRPENKRNQKLVRALESRRLDSRFHYMRFHQELRSAVLLRLWSAVLLRLQCVM